MSAASGSYTQDFVGLNNTGNPNWADNSTILNWYAAKSGTGNLNIQAGTGSASTGDLYSFGLSNTATDRAIGSVGSGGGTAGSFAWGVLLRNTSGAAITDVKVSFTGEQWRNSAAAAQTLNFYYKISSTTISNLNPGSATGWVAVSALNFTSPKTGVTAGALDGNLAANKTSFNNIAIPSLSLANNEYIMLKWDDLDHFGNDHGLATDDVTITWGATTCTPTKLSYTTIPTISLNQSANFDLVVETQNATNVTQTCCNNGTITLTANNACGLYQGSTLASNGKTVTATVVNGVATFSNLNFKRSTQANINFTATYSGTCGTLTNVTSSNINVGLPVGTLTTTTIKNENFDGSTPSWPYTIGNANYAGTSGGGADYTGLKNYSGNNVLVKSFTKNNTPTQKNQQIQ